MNYIVKNPPTTLILYVENVRVLKSKQDDISSCHNLTNKNIYFANNMHRCQYSYLNKTNMQILNMIPYIVKYWVL